MNDMNDKLALQKDLVVKMVCLMHYVRKLEVSQKPVKTRLVWTFMLQTLSRRLVDTKTVWGPQANKKRINLSYSSFVLQAYSCIAKIRVQKKWFVADELHTHYILEALKHFKEDEKVVFWAVNALYHMSKDGPNIIVSNVKAMLDSDAKAYLRSALLCKMMTKTLKHMFCF